MIGGTFRKLDPVRLPRARHELFWIAVLGLSAAGCARQHSIEPGAWRLAFQANDRRSEQYVAPPAEVEVLVDWAEGDAELVTVQYFPPRTGQGEEKPYALEGRLDGGKLKLQGTTRDWQVDVWGEVVGPRTLRGSVFARGRVDDTLIFDGTWRMVKLRPRE